MNTLEKLGINAKSVYEHLLTGNRAKLGWHYWKFYAWPAYSEMLEALIESVLEIPEMCVGNCDAPNGCDCYVNNNMKAIQKATGKTWDEISKLLEVV